MFDITNLPLQADQARAARNYLGLSQSKAAEASELPLHKIKRFEAGNYIPDTPFLEDLRAFYEARGFLFNDTPEPGANAKGSGLVFPAGVVGDGAPSPAAARIKPQVSTLHHMRIAVTDDAELGRILDVIETHEEKAEELLRQPVAVGFLGGLSDESEARHAEALKLLAGNGLLFARLFGRDVGGLPKPDVLNRKREPESHADLLHRSQADAHLTVNGDRDAKARIQGRKPAKTLSAALFG